MTILFYNKSTFRRLLIILKATPIFSFLMSSITIVNILFTYILEFWSLKIIFQKSFLKIKKIEKMVKKLNSVNFTYLTFILCIILKYVMIKVIIKSEFKNIEQKCSKSGFLKKTMTIKCCKLFKNWILCIVAANP